MSARTLAWLILMSFCVVLFLRVQSVFQETTRRNTAREQATYEQIREMIASGYVDPVDEKELFYGSLKGMAAALNDPYSAFLPPKNAQRASDETRGSFAGVGIEISSDENKRMLVLTPLIGSPAIEAGILPGDVILKVDGISLEGMTNDEGSELIRGAPETSVHLTVERKGEAKALEFDLKRREIKKPSIEESYMLEAPSTANARIPDGGPKIGYIALTAFQANSAKELSAALADLEKQGLQGLILDLRDNHGGLLDQAVEISDMFLKDGTIVTLRGRNAAPEVTKVYLAHPSDEDKTYPVVLLVNHTSASASEIVAGCLKDRGRAYLVGEKTFGKALVQTIIPVDLGPDGQGALKITTARYLPPGGENFQGKGIDPNYEVPFTNEQVNKLLQLRRDRHIARNQAAAGKPVTPPPDTPDTFYDLQLEKAVEVLTASINKK